MDSNVKFPKEIEATIKTQYEERVNRLNEEQKESIGFLLDPTPVIDDILKISNEFVNLLIEPTNKLEFINLIENFKIFENFDRFIASILVYQRIQILDHLPDKFLYFCIAVEAAMQFKNKNGKKSKLFKEFFKDNLAVMEKVFMIQHYKNFEVKNIVKGTDFLVFKSGRKRTPKKTRTNALVPSCYKQKHCYRQYGECYPEHGCYLIDKPDKIDQYLEPILDYLYQKRSFFVHDGRVPPFGTVPLSDVYYNDKKRENPVAITYSLDFADLCKFYERALLNKFKMLEILYSSLLIKYPNLVK